MSTQSVWRIRVEADGERGYHARAKPISRILTGRKIRHYQAKGCDNWRTLYFVLLEPVPSDIVEAIQGREGVTVEWEHPTEILMRKTSNSATT